MSSPEYASPLVAHGLPVGVRNIIVATVVVYVLQLLPGIGEWVGDLGSLVSVKVFTGRQIWRLGTYMFLHGTYAPWHLAFNMLALWMFGVEIENMWGARRFVAFYLICGVGAGLLSFATWYTPIIGASGAILAVLTIYAVHFPNRQVLVFFLFPIPVWLLVVIIGFASIVMARNDGGVAHLTHLGGIVVALIYLRLYNPIMAGIAAWRSRRSEVTVRRAAEERAGDARYYEEVVDPILEKISRHGMDSLTESERASLERAARRPGKQDVKNKVIEVDFRKR